MVCVSREQAERKQYNSPCVSSDVLLCMGAGARLALAPRASFKSDTLHRREPAGRNTGTRCVYYALCSAPAVFSFRFISGKLMGSSEAEIQAIIFKSRANTGVGVGGTVLPSPSLHTSPACCPEFSPPRCPSIQICPFLLALTALLYG